ncbi:MAG TPA: heavy metal translocating P-type ATPase [Woeseiaceae bacterium]|nr:heavy metal translocating P-type ATPase [Woeseiaceae bacterium]
MKPLTCYHCAEPVPPGAPYRATIDGREEPVCCAGCQAVAELIHAQGLEAYYRFREAPSPAEVLRPEASEWSRYDAPDLTHRYVLATGDFAEATVEIGGMYCSACVWLLERALRRCPDVQVVSVNPATRRAVLRWRATELSFGGLLAAIAEVGFRPRPLAPGRREDAAEGEYRRALKRLLVAAAAGMQVMMFSFALYAGGWFGIEAGIEQFLRWTSLLVTVPIVTYSARPFYAAAWRGIRAASPGMDLPVAIAITAAFLASARATLAGSGEVWFDSVAMFVLFLSGTRFLEMRARHRADDQATALARLLPDSVTRVRGETDETVPLDALEAGDLVRVRPGEVVPADGEVVSGMLALDESLLTGEAMPCSRAAGARVLAGSVNRGGSGLVRVVRTGAETTLAAVGRLIERAKADRPPVAVLADRIARRFVPGVLLVALATGAVWLKLDPGRAFEIALATLVVTCPCALALATPAALAAAASALARRGFLLVRARLLDVLGHGATVVFDKTGTLTEGRPRVVQATCPDPDWPQARCLALAAALEKASGHVLARAFDGDPGPFRASEAQVECGRGVEALVDGARWRIGSAAYLTELCAAPPPAQDGMPEGCTRVLLGNEERVVAAFAVGDELRADAAATVAALEDAGLKPVIASGDREPAVRAAAVALGVEEWHSGLTPAGKVALVERLQARGETVVMVGDGVNDAPVLAAADASIAIDAGTALACATADAIVPGRRLATLLDGVRVAAMTRRVIRQNLAWALAYNLAAVPLAASGWLAPWMAALGMSASSLLVVMNALRVYRHAAPATPVRRPHGRALPLGSESPA